ncbi:hypothetical protein [Spirosoma aerophilum]
MKLFIISVVFALTLSTCRSKPDIIPNTIWSSGCIELRPEQGLYQLDGMCCAYVLMPPVDLSISHSMAVPGSYHSFTGAGFDSTAIEVFLQVSTNPQRVFLSYTLPNQFTAQNWVLAPGPAKLACQCGCD